MKKKWLLLSAIFTIATVLAGCENPLMVLDPKGPNAKTLSDTIIMSIIVMCGILFVVYVLYAYMLIKYRASRMGEDYEPPHEHGSTKLEIIWTVIPIIIVVFLSVITVQSTSKVESKPVGYENEEPLVIYAASSNWKWHFSYPEEGIETVNYVNLPVDRPVEFRLYSYGPITSFWIPQLAGQKYAMSAHVTKIHMAADVPGSYMGRNSNFNGQGYAQMEFEAQAMTQADYDEWVNDVKTTAPKLTDADYDKLLETDFVGRKSYSSTHLEFNPPPEGQHHGTPNEGTPNTEEDGDKTAPSSEPHTHPNHTE
ncbi:cytochrome aa3 quinol oxidase subunit II [Domibacillus sp. PGB-M46]|uniref:cytochrome aa3 quinol oxidase subunit II n=1 Tax=Domibacillus sp. PGB-M46 TaxID=2910255 RepID=UPI001F591808|nr:cytochrome aa3 quinol oxidase subunit II [Domibacillus sp. PGB-M46]MCI2253985.1 cytochrome aa3 quinol oxidase subunit II [Domibacillus sp. PGB-M46]